MFYKRPVNTTTPQDPADAFNRLIEAVLNRVLTSLNGFIPMEAAERLWLEMIGHRLLRMRRRFAAIVALLRAGKLPAPASAAPKAARPARPSRWIYPYKRFGWVMYDVSYFVQLEQHELEELLEDPDMEALVAAAPQLGRELRPFCHMLAVKQPEWLRLPRKPRPSRAVVIPPAPEWLLAEPGALLYPDGTVWMRLGASRHWKPGHGETLEESQKYDYPVKIWPRD